MARATIPGGKLVNLKDCYIQIPNGMKIELNNLPDLSDTKGASYNDEVIMGRSFPLKSFSHSENRAISMTLHFFVVNKEDISINMQYLRAIESCTYPRTANSGLAFQPPPVCQIKCGKLLGEDELCVVLRSYSVKFPTDAVWDEETYVPFKFDVDTSWEVVYRTVNLPGQEKILAMGK